MSSSQSSLSARTASYYSQLSSVATELNAVSDELGKSIGEIDAALKKLNLGISAWVEIDSGRGDEGAGDNSYWTEEIGYAKVNGKWGISLRTCEGEIGDGDNRVEESLFNDAPRALRLAAIEKIPELLEKLSNEAVETTQKLQSKLDDVQTVAASLRMPVPAAPRPVMGTSERTFKTTTDERQEQAGRPSDRILKAAALWTQSASDVKFEGDRLVHDPSKEDQK